MEERSGKIVLSEEVYRDKVMGCYIGKNAGGTLGGPYERKFGSDEMFNVSWYSHIPEGGIPNDDLEMQLVWLQALQERGPGIRARDLVEYWLNCIAYNFDEYGLSKTNLKKGLIPPVSGWYNNWFKDCMGSPIRSEIWACVSPAVPEIAVHYAFEDAICDHAGGESVYGEVFNAALESAAFVVSDKLKLVEMGLSFIPEKSLTYRAIRRVVELYLRGVDWKEVREKIKEEFYNPVAQYSPINLGYQTIALLYGESFGDALCKAVNCGWDTDCTAGTVGAVLGIIMGAKNLPKDWTNPLSGKINTNLTTGGIKYLEVPTNIYELTERIVEIGKRVLSYWGANVIVSDAKNPSIGRKSVIALSKEEMSSIKRKIESYCPKTLDWDLITLKVGVTYESDPAIIGDKYTRFVLKITNPNPELLLGDIYVNVPASWEVEPKRVLEAEFLPLKDLELWFKVKAPAFAIFDRNTCEIKIRLKERPELPAIPVVFIGGSRWLVSEVFAGKKLENDCGVLEEKWFDAKPERWREMWFSDNDLKAEEIFEKRKGVIYFLHFIYSYMRQKVVIGVPTNGRMKIWMNGRFLHQTTSKVPFRPSQGNSGGRGDGSNYTKALLEEGWNQFLIKVEKDSEPIQVHFLLGSVDEEHPINDGGPVLGVRRSLFPWEGMEIGEVIS